MKFSDVAVGQKFKISDIVCAKIEPQKVSCCKTLNAMRLDTNEKIMVKPIDEVELVQE